MNPPAHENNFPIELIRKLKLLFSFGDTNPANRIGQIHELSSFLERIASSPAVLEGFMYFLEHDASSAWVLQVDLGMPEATAYRVLKRLRELRLIVSAIRTSKVRGVRGGPRPTIWALVDADSEKIARALQRHYRSLSPKYRTAEEVAQSLIDDYLRPHGHRSIPYLLVRQVIKERTHFGGPDLHDATWMACEVLKDSGYLVIRR